MSDMGITPKVMLIIDHSVKEGADLTHVVFPAHAVRRDRLRKAVQSMPAGHLTSTWKPIGG
jgi:hypothetical protein